jgi:cilia- and flagella-associated protein 251
VLGGPDLEPFYRLIEGGREGNLFKEMKELFYYSQLRQLSLLYVYIFFLVFFFLWTWLKEQSHNSFLLFFDAFSHGLNENTERVIKLTIPLKEIPFVMRALGFYPTEQEVHQVYFKMIIIV